MSMINPLGFTLEHFDAGRRFSRGRKGTPIESSGGLPERGPAKT